MRIGELRGLKSGKWRGTNSCPIFSEVKAEIRDDMERLHRSSNGRFELFLLTTEGSTHSDGSSGLPKTARHHMVPGPAPTSMYHLSQNAYRQAVHQYDNSCEYCVLLL
ncbi:hypothetical protein COOONC_05883 [Cooperia oncophora]